MKNEMRAGDFSGLAGDYSNSRPDYSASILTAILSLVDKPVEQVDFADIGAGTGIWTRMVNRRRVKSAIAVEPNDDMRRYGVDDSSGANIQWFEGSAENTTLDDNSIDLLTMASSFHWADFDAATKEFHRVLRDGGRFAALWNPRLIEVSPLLVEIEAKLDVLRPNVKRVSSGRSGITETLSEQLWASPYFTDVVYLEGRHVINMTPDRYLSAWRSVNDLQVQLGGEKFNQFLQFVEDRTSGLSNIEATYLTRAWSAKKK